MIAGTLVTYMGSNRLNLVKNHCFKKKFIVLKNCKCHKIAMCLVAKTLQGLSDLKFSAEFK